LGNIPCTVRPQLDEQIIEDNLDVDAWLRHDDDDIHRDTDRMNMPIPILANERTRRAGDLSSNQRQMPALRRSLKSRRESLILDEPSAEPSRAPREATNEPGGVVE
jgi:ABC-type branched-subunit amino acid transport system ATPase component